MKFGIQCDNITFGCAWLDYPDADIILHRDLHSLVLCKGAGASMRLGEILTPKQQTTLPKEFRNWLDVWLIAVGAHLSSDLIRNYVT
jgi:hypothetical protein